MASDRSQRKSKDKWKEKSWYTIVSPGYLGEKEIAVSPSYDDDGMIGRKIEVPVSDFTGNFKKANSKILFKIVSCQGKKCSTMFIGHSVSDDFIKRMVRRRKERIDIVRNATTTDGYTMSVKTVIVTDGKLTNTKRVAIRRTIEEFLDEKSKGMGYEDFTRYLIGDEVYNDMVSATKDVYPIRKLEIRKSLLIDVKEGAETTVQESSPEETPPEQVS